MWFIYTMKYYAAVRKKEFLTFATTWMELESIMLSEISQSEKDKYHVILFMEYNEQHKLMNKNRSETEKHRSDRQTSEESVGVCEKDQPKDLYACI